MSNESAHERDLVALTGSQRRRLAILERRLDAQEPALAESMRRGQVRRAQFSPYRVVVAGVIGVPLVLVAAVVGATSMVSELWAWSRPD